MKKFLKAVSSGGSKIYGGFGISTGEQSKALCDYVEGVVVRKFLRFWVLQTMRGRLSKN